MTEVWETLKGFIKTDYLGSTKESREPFGNATLFIPASHRGDFQGSGCRRSFLCAREKASPLPHLIVWGTSSFSSSRPSPGRRHRAARTPHLLLPCPSQGRVADPWRVRKKSPTDCQSQFRAALSHPLGFQGLRNLCPLGPQASLLGLFSSKTLPVTGHLVHLG